MHVTQIPEKNKRKNKKKKKKGKKKTHQTHLCLHFLLEQITILYSFYSIISLYNWTVRLFVPCANGFSAQKFIQIRGYFV